MILILNPDVCNVSGCICIHTHWWVGLEVVIVPSVLLLICLLLTWKRNLFQVWLLHHHPSNGHSSWTVFVSLHYQITSEVPSWGLFQSGVLPGQCHLTSAQTWRGLNHHMSQWSGIFLSHLVLPGDLPISINLWLLTCQQGIYVPCLVLSNLY